MHILIAFLGSIVSLLWILHRLADMGISLGGLNPFLWRRRRRWKAQYQANPIFQITDPMESTALMLLAVAKADGDMSAEGKRALLKLFRDEFELSDRDATGLLAASAHILGKGDEVKDSLDKVLKPSLEKFGDHHLDTAIELLEKVALSDGAASAAQRDLVNRATAIFRDRRQPVKKWDA